MKKTNLMLIIGLMMVLSLGLVSAQTCDFEIDRHSDSVMFIPGTPGGVNNEYTVNCLVAPCENVTITNNVLVNEAINGVASEYASGSTSHWRGLPEYVNDGNIYTYHTMYNDPAWQIDFASPKEIVGGKVLFDYILDSTYSFNQYEVTALVDGVWELIYSSSKNDTNDWHVFMHDDVVVASSLRLRFDLGGEWHNNKIKLFQWEVLSKDLILEDAGSPHLVDMPGMGSNTDFLSVLTSESYTKQVYFDSIDVLKNYAFVDTVSNGTCESNSVWVINTEPYGDNVLNENTGVRYTTIQGAIDAASNGDALRLSAMTYYENLVIEKPVSLIGEGPSQTVIKGVIRDDSIIRVVGEDGNRLSGVRIEGMTLDHQSMGNIEQFSSVSGVSAAHVSDLTVKNVHMINFGEPGNFAYERGGLSISSADNVLLDDIVVNDVYGTFTRGLRLSDSYGVVVDGFVMSGVHTDSVQDWLFYLHTVENSSFSNVLYEDLTVHGTNQVTLRAIDLAFSSNNQFDNIVIKNVGGIHNNVPIKLEYSNHNEFRNMNLKNMDAAFIASAIEVTHESEYNLFEDILIENFKADVQARGLNVDRGAKNNTFRNIVIDEFKGEFSTLTDLSVIGINVNVRDPNGNTSNNLFENISFTKVNTPTNFYGVNLGSVASGAYNKDNVFKNLSMVLGEEDSFAFAAGFRDGSDCGNYLIDSLFDGFNKSIETVNQEPYCLSVQNNKILNNGEALISIDVDNIDDYCMNNYFDFLGFVKSENVVQGNLRNTMGFFDLSNPLKAVATEDVFVRTRNEDVVGRIIFPEGVEISREDNESIDIENFVGKMMEEEFVVDGKESVAVLKIGHVLKSLDYSVPVSIDFLFLNGYEGEEMSVYRSMDGVTWTTEGLVNSTCTVIESSCIFETIKASYFALVHDEPEQAEPEQAPSRGGGGATPTTTPIVDEPVDESREAEIISERREIQLEGAISESLGLSTSQKFVAFAAIVILAYLFLAPEQDKSKKNRVKAKRARRFIRW